MGIEFELILLLIMQAIGNSLFCRFETVTPGWRKPLKWIMIDGISFSLFYAIGDYSLLFPALLLIIDPTVDFKFCRKHGIDLIKATQRKKYYKLTGREWQEGCYCTKL